MSNEKPLVEWESFPLVENFLRSFILIFVMSIILFVLWIVTVIVWEAPFYYVLGMLFLFVPLLPYFIPTRYQLFEHRILVIYLFFKNERRYSDFSCYYADKKGVMLGTFKMPRWLDSYRGQSLRFSKSQEEKEILMNILEEKIGNEY